MIQNSYASSDITVEETKMFKPVAFQIRYKGCKGMVVEYPIEGRKIRIRPSMNKFECTTSKYLEIVKTSSPSLFDFLYFFINNLFKKYSQLPLICRACNQRLWGSWVTFV